MTIYDRNLTGTSAPETGRAQESHNLDRPGSGTSTTRGGVDRSNDRVEFSGTLGSLSRAITTFESTRADRVLALAGEYQSGNYKADALATSKGLVAEAISDGMQ
jgi:hypothetical protein